MRAFSGFGWQKTVPINLYDLFPYASLEKRSKVKSLADYLESIINVSEDKNAISREFIEKEIKKYHRPTRKNVAFKEESFFDIMEKYLSTHKLSVPRRMLE